MLINYVLGFADEESRLTERAKREFVDIDELGKTYPEQFQALSRERYTHFARLALYTTSADWDNEFLFGIHVLLDGFEAKRM